MFPTLSEYNKTILKEGAKAFSTLKNIYFLPAKTSPIKIYSFGSGSFAVVFKAIENNKEIAIRCFIGTDNDYVERYRKITSYLKPINENWKTDIEFLENEITVNGRLFPVIKMDWVEGKLFDNYLNANIQNNKILQELQNEVLKVSKSLENYKIAHGDIQCGNIIIKELNGKPQIKLIDYDGMFIPAFKGHNQIESGRSEFQHPDRRQFEFNEKIDRFSFWILLCALEALKFDKTLWKETMQGGFNTLDNLLFVGNDFLNPNHSKLFNRLKNLNQPSVNFYIDKIKSALYNSVNNEVQLYNYNNENAVDLPVEESHTIVEDDNKKNKLERIEITTKPSGAIIRNSKFEVIGRTPISINKYDYIDQELKLISGVKIKSIYIHEYCSNIIYHDFEGKAAFVNKEEEIIKPLEEKEKEKDSSLLFVFVAALIIILLFVLLGSQKTYTEETISEEEYETTVEEAPVEEVLPEVFTDTNTMATEVQNNYDDNYEENYNTEIIDFHKSQIRKFDGGYVVDKVEFLKYDNSTSNWELIETSNYGEFYMNNFYISARVNVNNKWWHSNLQFDSYSSNIKSYILADDYNQTVVIDEDFKTIKFFAEFIDNLPTEAYIYYILKRSELVSPY